MGRRSTLVAFAAVALAALVPVSAHAATGATGVSAATAGPNSSTVTVSWTPSAVDPPTSQEVWRASGGCSATPIAGAAGPFAVGAGATSFSEGGLPNGSYCYYVEADNADLITPTAYSAGAGVTVNVDTTAPIANTPTASPPNPASGPITISASSNDPTATNTLHRGTTTCDVTSPVITSPWNPPFDGTYLICNVATDPFGNVSAPSAPLTVIADNTAPTGAVSNPAPASFVRGSVSLTSTAADANGIRSVQYQHAASGGGPWFGAGTVNGPSGNGFASSWVTTAPGNAGAGGDGPELLRAVITDNAGNTTTTAAFAITVDNTVPDVPPVLAAPPAVASSPTISWTAAHDAIGVSRYDVLRGGSVIGSVAAGQGLAFSDKNAPDQQVSTYIVRAYDAAGNFAGSNAALVRVDSTAVSAPRALTAVTPTHAAPLLTWQAPATFRVAHYDVYRDGLLLGSTLTSATTYTDATVTEGTHAYAVLARDAAGTSGVLSGSFKVIYDVTPPTSGGSPSASILAAGVSLAWPAATDALSGVAGYRVRRTTGATASTAADAGAAVCAPASTSCLDAAPPTGLSSYSFFAVDAAGNVALVGTIGSVNIIDRTPPLAPTKLKAIRAKAKAPFTSIVVTLRWIKPTATDLARVVVVLNLKRPPKTPKDGKVVYKGLRTFAKARLRAGQNGYFAVYAYDQSNNVSLKPARIVVKLASLIPLRPLNGSRIRTSTPVLSWKPTKGTNYYNVQVFVKGRRVLVGWPTKATFTIPAGKLVPGTYVWYVWPALRGKQDSFGKLIGRATFRYQK